MASANSIRGAPPALAGKQRTPDPLRGPPAKLLGRNTAARDNKASTMARQLAAVLRQIALLEARAAVAEVKASEFLDVVLKSQSRPVLQDIRKAPTRRELEQALRRILVTHGVRALNSAARRAAGGPVDVTDAAMREFLRTKEVQLQQIMASARRDVRESVRVLVAQSVNEIPRPSIGELARRIHQTFHGGPGGGPRDQRFDIRATPREQVPPGRFVPVGIPAPRRGSRVLPTERFRTTEGGNLYAFSPERAELIARTEMAQAENTGIVEGYKATGVLGLEWLAYDDGRTGDRRHNEMKGLAVEVGDRFYTPLGNWLRYPGDPMAPIGETANCRCSTRPIYDPDELERKRQR